MDQQTAFQQLTPDQMLAAVESQGYRCDGRFLTLNSYENRVFQVGTEEDDSGPEHAGQPIIAKFYRPGRWSDEAILEEHHFTLDLADAEIPVVAPLRNGHGETLHAYDLFRFALYPRRGGHPPELDNPAQLETLGRFIARIHLLGEVEPFDYRPALDVASFGREPASYLLATGCIPEALEPAYRTLIDHLLGAIEEQFALAGEVRWLRAHGDCHPSNILCRDGAPRIVDFDDARMAPAVQDLWMFLSGERSYQSARLADLLAGYTQFRDFDPRELRLIEPLRSLRIIHYAAWLAQRWSDPAFQRAFPWFASARYWDDHILSLREQLALLQEPPLVWD